MGKVEQAGKYCCNICTRTDGKDRIVGGDFCVVFSRALRYREKFSEDKLMSNGRMRFWSRQCKGAIEECPIFKKYTEQEHVARLEKTEDLILETMKLLV